MKAPEPPPLPVDEADLDRLEGTLRRAVLSGDPFVDEIATHLIDAGGKRLRPALTVASSTLSGGAVSDDTLLAAVSVELVHIASLYHDDVMDEAMERRNVVSVNGRWGNLLAIVVGDYLLARSAEIATSLGTEIARVLAATLARLCQGQVAEVRSAYHLDLPDEAYLSTIADKTGALMGTACRLGAITGGLSRRDTSAVTEFGELVGVVFQIRDDILDVIATEEEAGKPPGRDLAEGIYTLPVQRALTDPAVGGELRALLGRPLAADEVDEARLLVAASEGIAEAREVARTYAARAAEAASRLPKGPTSRAFAELGLRLIDDVDRSAEAVVS